MDQIAHNLSDKERTVDVILEENVSFESLLLPEQVLNGLASCGFRKPSPIQFKALPLARCGFDLVVKSKSGTGKTLVFSITALEAVNVSRNQLQVLILAPTREIAVQIEDVLKNIGSSVDGLKVASFIGGLPIEEDTKKAKGCHIAVGAPGRVKHLFSLGALSPKSVRLLILDEADKLMESSFKADIQAIYDSLPEKKQVIATSATYPKELEAFLTHFMLSPTHISAEINTPLLLGLKQFVSVTDKPANIVQAMKIKNARLLQILTKISFAQCLVFTNYQTRAESVSNFLNQKDWNSIYISAAQSQTKRLEAVNNLKTFKNRILLSTDLTSRGIDAPNVDLVINYDIPLNAVTYLHRMGRAGRFGATGMCVNLAASGEELKQLQYVLGAIGIKDLTISKLPPLEDDVQDVWQLDHTTLEQISAITGEVPQEVKDGIKEEIMGFKVKNRRNSKKRRGSGDETEESLEELSVEIIKNSEKSEVLLQSLIPEPEESLLTHESDKMDDNSAEALLQSLIANPEEVVATNGLLESKCPSDNKDAIYFRNTALLNITRLVCDPSTKIDSDMASSIDQYRKASRTEEVVSIVANIKNSVEEEPSEVQCHSRIDTEDGDVMSNIFEIGYKCAINGDSKSWIHCLPPSELATFRESQRELLRASDDEDDYDFVNEDYEMEDGYGEENQIVSVSRALDEDIGKRWVPVVRNEAPVQANNEHFMACYEECNDSLWQNGLAFENVQSFDEWFYHWQESLNSVRSYVQQNIYVQEMSHYQHTRNQHQ